MSVWKYCLCVNNGNVHVTCTGTGTEFVMYVYIQYIMFRFIHESIEYE